LRGTPGSARSPVGLNSPATARDLRLELTDDDEPVLYCEECFEREFGEEE
jgi:hypothetical protein